MIATFAIEIALAVYVTLRYKSSAVTRLASAILFLLALFQLAEFNVCEGAFAVDNLTWARLGYASITMLPPLGIHLISRLAGTRNAAMITAAYATGVAFMAYFTFSTQNLATQTCLGNYVLFSKAPQIVPIYAAYYYGWLLTGVTLAFRYARVSRRPNIANALRAFGIGYLLFLVPTTLVNIIDPATIAGIPSIMCGFAVLLAIILAGRVVPEYFKQPALAWFHPAKVVGVVRAKIVR